jgi:hypothetical protein
MTNKSKGLYGYIIGAGLVLSAFLPIWAYCSDACGNRGAVNLGLLALGLGIVSIQALFASKIPKESKRGCSVMLIAIFLPITLLGFALMVNFWYLLSLAGPALILGLALFIVGIVIYTKSLK